MSRPARRILITSLVMLVAAAIVAVVFTSAMRPVAQPAATNNQTAQNQPPAAPSTSSPGAGAAQQPESSAPAEPPAESAESTASQPATAEAAPPPPGMHALAPARDLSPRDQPPQALGSLDPREREMKVEFSRRGASIARVAFSNIWTTAEARRRAERYLRTVKPGEPIDFSQLDESQRYTLTNIAPAYSIVVNGQPVSLLSENAWAETAAGTFESTIVDGEGNPLLEVQRQFSLNAAFDVTLHQTVRNVSGQSLQVQLVALGPTDLQKDVSGYIDRRRFDIGYLPDPQRQPDLVLAGDFEADRTELLKRFQRAHQAKTDKERHDLLTLWPNAHGQSRGYALSWFASMNRYFSVAVHPSAGDVARGVRSLDGVIESIRLDVSQAGTPDDVVFTWLDSPVITLAAGMQQASEMGLYAGPLDRRILHQDPFAALAMHEMVLYRMGGGCCTFLTFQWLARLLLWFLSFLHDYVVFDWGLAIIALVVVVRAILHPLTKRSQINMQRFGKQMAAMKPEIDKLQKKFGNDPKRMQVEQMKLMREHGINPFQMLGCLPMFLQTPIWIALWAMLYFAFEIRHEPAFWGVFQLVDHWQFLGDLSSPDNFWILPGGGFTIPLVKWHVDSLNLLPILLGVVFFVQQKYMSPPPTPNMTPEQVQQQRIMKVMMVVLMPLFLYKAPSGLTLYMFTSSCIGILESKYIRSHITQLDLQKPGDSGGVGVPRNTPPKKPKDSLGRMWAERLEAARAKRRGGEPPRSFKKRK